MIKKRFISIFAALAVAFGMAGCKSNDVDTGQAEQTSRESQQITTDTDISIENLPESEDILLPDGMTMDNLRNMLIINGKTLTLPTSLNELMALDDKFSYEAEYIDENNWQYNGVQTGFFVDVLYDDVLMFTTGFASNENNVQSILDKNINNVAFGKNGCKKTDINVNLSCGLGFGSSFEDIKNIFNEPNIYNFNEASKGYEFHDDEYSYELTFKINSKTDTIGIISIVIRPNDTIGGNN